MRVCLYARDFPLTGDRFEGGLNKAVHGLASGFAKNGIAVTVLCSGRSDSVFTSQSGYEIRSFERTTAQRLGMALSPKLVRYLEQRDKSDIFILNGVFSPDTYLVARACIRSGLSYYCWPHDPYTKALFKKKAYLKWPYWYLRDRPMLRRAEAIQVFDEDHAGMLRNLGVSTRTLIIDNGVDPADAIPESALSWNEDGPPRLIYLGRIDYFNKALDVLLDAFAEIGQRSDATLTLQGPDDGDLQMLKARATALGLSAPRLEFRPPQFDRSASEILSEYDMFVLPSRFEGFGLAAMEAMVAGRVLILSEVSGLAKHIRAAGCGVVVRPDKESVKDAFSQLMDARPNWKAMGLAGREYALSHFSWEQIAAGLLEEYRRSE